jgi:hypothetical protein
MSSHLTDYGAAPTFLHFCPKCYPLPSLGIPDHPPGQDSEFPWAVVLVCPSCTCKYTLCTICPKQRSRLTSSYLRKRHNRRFHTPRQTVPSNLPLELPYPSIADPINQPLPIQEASVITIPALNTDSPSLQSGLTDDPFEYHVPYQDIVIYSTKQSTLYFQHHINDGKAVPIIWPPKVFST